MGCQAVLMVTWKHYVINNGQGKLVALGPFLTVLDELHTPDSHMSFLFKVWSLDQWHQHHLRAHVRRTESECECQDNRVLGRSLLVSVHL